MCMLCLDLDTEGGRHAERVPKKKFCGKKGGWEHLCNKGIAPPSGRAERGLNLR